MSNFASTTEGTGAGAVERYIPRIVNNLIRLENLEPRILQTAVQAASTPTKIDGGIVQALSMLNITEQEAQIIIQAAEILRRNT